LGLKIRNGLDYHIEVVGAFDGAQDFRAELA
jgi:hypothetical protein